MSSYSLIEEINDTVREYIERNMQDATASDLGLDIRAGYNFQVDEETIAVRKYDDRNLQYYGGFEYVNKDYRTEMGDWVFYMKDPHKCGDELCRVGDCLDTFYSKQKENENV